MFDINGGTENVLKMILLIMTLVLFTVFPAILAYSSDDKNRYFLPSLSAIVGFVIWFLLLWIGNPSLDFWKVQ